METTILHLGFYETSGNNFTFIMTLKQSFYPCYNRTTNIHLIIAWFNVMPSIESHYRVIHLDSGHCRRIHISLVFYILQIFLSLVSVELLRRSTSSIIGTSRINRLEWSDERDALESCPRSSQENQWQLFLWGLYGSLWIWERVL